MSLQPEAIAYHTANAGSSFFFGSGIYGIVNNLTWQPVVGTTQYASTFSVPGANANTVVLAVRNACVDADKDIFLVKVFGQNVSGGIINIYISGNPSTPTDFAYSWYIAKL